MKFLVDAQLPKRLVRLLKEAGHEAIHTSQLPERNATTDSDIIVLATKEQYIVITKDEDFVNSYILRRLPPKLLLISTGNIRNVDPETLIIQHLAQIEVALLNVDFVELIRSRLIVHS